MKTGAIVYVIGEENADNDFDVTEAVRNLKIEADQVETVSPRSGHFDIMDAWWSLTVRGMKRIVCMTAEIVNGSDVRLTGREIQLCE